MLASLFARLTADRDRGAALFMQMVSETRSEHWYVGGEVPDTVDGRFAVLATVTALATARLDRLGARELAVALVERFVDSLDAELREMGIGDPALGKQVRRIVASLESRVGLWADATSGRIDWSAAVSRSLYRNGEPLPGALAHSAAALRDLWGRLERADEAALIEGRIE